MSRVLFTVVLVTSTVGLGQAAERRPADDLMTLVDDLKKPDAESRRKAAQAICDLCKDGDIDPAGVMPT